jgi:hypothetical protein
MLHACAGFMTAYASAAYRRSFFDDEVFKQEAGPEGCKHHDDIWFSGHLWVRQVRQAVAASMLQPMHGPIAVAVAVAAVRYRCNSRQYTRWDSFSWAGWCTALVSAAK